jgi:hypothetical protein
MILLILFLKLTKNQSLEDFPAVGLRTVIVRVRHFAANALLAEMPADAGHMSLYTGQGSRVMASVCGRVPTSFFSSEIGLTVVARC